MTSACGQCNPYVLTENSRIQMTAISVDLWHNDVVKAFIVSMLRILVAKEEQNHSINDRWNIIKTR